MKTPEELNVLKKEYTELNIKLAELTEDELSQVAGGMKIFLENVKCPYCGQVFKYLSPNHVVECAKKNILEKNDENQRRTERIERGSQESKRRP